MSRRWRKQQRSPAFRRGRKKKKQRELQNRTPTPPGRQPGPKSVQAHGCFARKRKSNGRENNRDAIPCAQRRRRTRGRGRPAELFAGLLNAPANNPRIGELGV